MSHFKNAIDMGRGSLCGCHKPEDIIQIYNHTDKFALIIEIPIKFCTVVNKEKGFSAHGCLCGHGNVVFQKWR